MEVVIATNASNVPGHRQLRDLLTFNVPDCPSIQLPDFRQSLDLSLDSYLNCIVIHTPESASTGTRVAVKSRASPARDRVGRPTCTSSDLEPRNQPKGRGSFRASFEK